MDNAFAALFDLYRATTAAERASPGGRDFNTTLAELLTSGNNPDRLSLYVIRSQTAAENGQHEGYRPACWRRSMLQILGDEFVAWSSCLRPVDLEALSRIDEILERVAASARPVLEEEVPDWVPRTHWWWWEPARRRGEEVTGMPRVPTAPSTRSANDRARWRRSGHPLDAPHQDPTQQSQHPAHRVQGRITTQMDNDRPGQRGGDHLWARTGDVDDPQVLGPTGGGR